LGTLTHVLVVYPFEIPITQRSLLIWRWQYDIPSQNSRYSHHGLTIYEVIHTVFAVAVL